MSDQQQPLLSSTDRRHQLISFTLFLSSLCFHLLVLCEWTFQITAHHRTSICSSSSSQRRSLSISATSVGLSPPLLSPRSGLATAVQMGFRWSSIHYLQAIFSLAQAELQWVVFPSPVTVKDQLTLIVVAVVDVIVALAAALFLPLLLVWVQMLIATISSLLFIGVISSSTATSLSSSTVCPCTAAAVLCLIVAVMGEGRWSFPLLFSGQSCNSGRSIVIVSFY